MARTTKFEKTLVGMMIAGSTLFFHLTGALLYSSSNHTPLIKSYQELNKRKIELVRKVDEFQRYLQFSKIMKNVYDNLPNVKIYASGSSSIAIKSQVHESLAGRKVINDIFPLDFEEFLMFKGEERLLKDLKNIKKLQGVNLNKSQKFG